MTLIDISNEHVSKDNQVDEEKQYDLSELFKHVSNRQSREIEIKEEKLLLDLYFNTLSNSQSKIVLSKDNSMLLSRADRKPSHIAK
jgi:hypothetical protein